MPNQATRYTRDELDTIAYWEARGYTFKPGEKPPVIPGARPSWSTRHPKMDAALGLLVIVLGAAALVTLCIGLVMGWARWPA